MNSGGYAVIDDEYVLLSVSMSAPNTATISAAYSIPCLQHAAGARIWFADGSTGSDTRIC